MKRKYTNFLKTNAFSVKTLNIHDIKNGKIIIKTRIPVRTQFIDPMLFRVKTDIKPEVEIAFDSGNAEEPDSIPNIEELHDDLGGDEIDDEEDLLEYMDDINIDSSESIKGGFIKMVRNENIYWDSTREKLKISVMQHDCGIFLDHKSCGHPISTGFICRTCDPKLELCKKCIKPHTDSVIPHDIGVLNINTGFQNDILSGECNGFNGVKEMCDLCINNANTPFTANVLFVDLGGIIVIIYHSNFKQDNTLL